MWSLYGCSAAHVDMFFRTAVFQMAQNMYNTLWCNGRWGIGSVPVLQMAGEGTIQDLV